MELTCHSCKGSLNLNTIEATECPVCSVDIFKQIESWYYAIFENVRGPIRSEIKMHKDKNALANESLKLAGMIHKRWDQIQKFKEAATKLIDIFQSIEKSNYSNDTEQKKAGRLRRTVKSKFLIDVFIPGSDMTKIFRNMAISFMALDIERMNRHGQFVKA